MDCWHEERYQAMLDAAKKRPLLDTYPGQLLKGLIDSIEYDGCLDIGCGTGQVSELIKGRYVGIDLPHIVENVSRKSGFDEVYSTYDVEDRPVILANMYDLVIMSAFIDVMQHPIKVLGNILPHCKKYVIIHRQELSLYPTRITHEPSYGGFTHHSKINEKEFSEAITGFEVIERASCKYDNWENGGTSLLLKRIKEPCEHPPSHVIMVGENKSNKYCKLCGTLQPE